LSQTPLAALFERVCVDEEFRRSCEDDLPTALSNSGLSQDAKDLLLAGGPESLWLMAHAVSGTGGFRRDEYSASSATSTTPLPQAIGEVQFLLRIRPLVQLADDGTLSVSHQASVQPIAVPVEQLGEVGGPSPENPWGHTVDGLASLVEAVNQSGPDTRLASLEALIKGISK
jgi:hypothetical protein